MLAERPGEPTREPPDHQGHQKQGRQLHADRRRKGGEDRGMQRREGDGDNGDGHRRQVRSTAPSVEEQSPEGSVHEQEWGERIPGTP